MGAYTGTWMQAAAGAAGSALGIGVQRLGANYDRRQQAKTQQGLTDIQKAAEKEMMDYQQKKELEMWHATGYGAQMKQMQEAGINPGLMYGMGGGGGQSTGHGGSPAISGGTAQHVNTGAIGMQAGLQLALLGSQKNLLDTQAAKNAAETTKISGVDTTKTQTEISSLTQGIENAKAQQELTNIQRNLAEIDQEIKGSTQNAAKALILQELRTSYEKMEMIRNEGIISKETYDEKIRIIEQELIGHYAKNELTRTQTQGEKQDIKQSQAQIEQLSKQIALEYSKLANEQDKTKIQKQITDFETSFGKQAGQILQGILNARIGRGK